jgi:sulfopyruvate decarboxylase subunit beta
MKRIEVLQLLRDVKAEGVSIATMQAIPDWYEIGGGPLMHIDNQGCMGGASATGLGIAIAQPSRRVIIIDGDGSLCMQLGSLVSIASEAPKNFFHFVLVNGIYETSGAQPIPARDKLDFAALAIGAGYPHAFNFDGYDEFARQLPTIMDLEGPVLVALKVDQEPAGKGVPARPHDWAGALRQSLNNVA